MAIYYLTTDKGIELHNEILDTIRKLPRNNIFYMRLKAIEQEYIISWNPQKHFNYDEILDNTLDKAEKLIIDYQNDKEIQELNESRKIIILDALMGTGKSTYLIDGIINKQIIHIDESIKELADCGIYTDEDLKNYSIATKNFICIVPLLDECKRYKEKIANSEIFEPKATKGRGRKREHLKELLKQKKNIIATHALIETIDDDILELLQVLNYTLIIDEELKVLEQYKGITSKDLEILKKNKLITKDDKGFLIWNPKDDNRQFRYDETKRLCNLNCLMECEGTNQNTSIVMWNFPYKFFRYFEQIYIATYIWNGSIQKAYFDLHNIHYQHKTLINHQLVDYDKSLESEKRKEIKSLINIFDEENKTAYNNIGKPLYTSKKGRPTHPLSENWYEKNYKEYVNDKDNEKESTNLIKILKLYLYHIFHNEYNAKQSTIMWTCFKGNKKGTDRYRIALSGKGYTKSFVSCNCRGTNQYNECYNLAYLIDMVCNPNVIRFFQQHNIEIDEDLFSLSFLLQWIWRSRIRNGQNINIYIPSERMRNLLILWLNNKR